MRRFSARSSATCLSIFGTRGISSYGQITDEDRRWWKLHLEAHPDITLGTFTAFLDSCGTHTTKRLIERNVWTIEQVSQLSEDEVEKLKYKEGCVHMDVVWEHARAIAPELRKRELGADGATDDLQQKILELRKKRELEKRKQEILQNRKEEVKTRLKSVQDTRDAIAKKREELRKKQQMRQEQQQQKEGTAAQGVPSIEEAMKKAGGEK